jgi:hypothetical protein
LLLAFDIDQESQRLNWSFQRDGHPEPKGDGLDTGMFGFKKGDIVTLLVVGKSYLGRQANLQILDSHYITRPILNSRTTHPKSAGEYPLPSPFFGEQQDGHVHGACVSFGHGTAEVLPEAMIWPSEKSFVCMVDGRWDTSFVMTTKISYWTVDNEIVERFRVFTFDPETEVGTGAIPDREPAGGSD